MHASPEDRHHQQQQQQPGQYFPGHHSHPSHPHEQHQQHQPGARSQQHVPPAWAGHNRAADAAHSGTAPPTGPSDTKYGLMHPSTTGCFVDTGANGHAAAVSTLDALGEEGRANSTWAGRVGGVSGASAGGAGAGVDKGDGLSVQAEPGLSRPRYRPTSSDEPESSNAAAIPTAGNITDPSRPWYRPTASNIRRQDSLGHADGLPTAQQQSQLQWVQQQQQHQQRHTAQQAPQ
eukprot:scaffold130664_cov18-Tisochrysis_lutea.AAC.2